MAAKVMALVLLLSGCASPCRLTLDYQGNWRNVPVAYDFQPGVRCVY